MPVARATFCKAAMSRPIPGKSQLIIVVPPAKRYSEASRMASPRSSWTRLSFTRMALRRTVPRLSIVIFASLSPCIGPDSGARCQHIKSMVKWTCDMVWPTWLSSIGPSTVFR